MVLPPGRITPDPILSHEPLFEAVTELAHHGAVALGNRELPFQRSRVHCDAVRVGEQFLELCLCGGRHGAPVEFIAPDREPVIGSGLDRLRLVDAVGNEVARVDRLTQRVAEGRLLQLKEAQRVAHEQPVLGVVNHFLLGGAWRGGQPQLDAVEMPKHAAPLAVYRAVAFIGDHQIEVARRQFPVLRDHGLQSRNRDALGTVEPPARAQHMAGIVTEVVRERILGLASQGDPVHEKQDARDDSGLEQTLDESRRCPGLSGACRHLDQQLAVAAQNLGRQRLDAIELVVAIDYLFCRLRRWTDLGEPCVRQSAVPGRPANRSLRSSGHARRCRGPGTTPPPRSIERRTERRVARRNGSPVCGLRRD